MRPIRMAVVGMLVTASSVVLTSNFPAAGALDGGNAPTRVALNDVEFVVDAGVVVGDRGTVFTTIDGGSSWQRRNAGTAVDLHAVERDGDDIWIAGGMGTLLRSSDGGTTWCRQDSGTTATLYGLDASKQSETAVGAGGVILRATKATACGLSADVRVLDSPAWTIGSGPTLYDVEDDWVVGAAGTALRLDPVRTARSGTTEDLYGVDRATNTPTGREAVACGCSTVYEEVVAVGASGTIVRGSAANTSVTALIPDRSPTTRTLRDVTLRGGGTAGTFDSVAVGHGGTVVTGQRGSWSLTASGTSESLRAVWRGAATGVAVGDHGTVVLVPATSSPGAPGSGSDPAAGSYAELAADGGIFTFGDATFEGSTGAMRLNAPIVHGALDTSDRDGYWFLATDGGVFSFAAPFFGSLGGERLSARATALEPTWDGGGYWIALSDGSVRAFGSAPSLGDLAGTRLASPIVAMAATPSGRGFWLVGADGGVFAFGDAEYVGSLGGTALRAPIIDIAASPDGRGYFLLGADGGVFTFGSAAFRGSTGGLRLNAPVVAMAVAGDGDGYWLVASDGGVFTFGNATFLGSMGGTRLNAPVIDVLA